MWKELHNDLYWLLFHKPFRPYSIPMLLIHQTEVSGLKPRVEVLSEPTNERKGPEFKVVDILTVKLVY